MNESYVRSIDKSYRETSAKASLGEAISNNDWQNLAICSGMTHLFFQQEKERAQAKNVRELAAKAICSACPVVKECLDFALLHHEQGIWGGTNDEDRYFRHNVLPIAGVNTKFTRLKSKQ